ncbi:hypothetical protein RIF29_38125 [Crotalaria pallida]|uniref:Uncharacterized protein n=1 Tax=Crotalaria pallida TaxID=3830 RepID=A0AAN9HPE1_CROPI
MSILQYPEKGTTKDNSTQLLQVWNNAAFDGKEEEEEEEEELQLSSFPMNKKKKKTCSCSSDCSKENLNPNSPSSPPVSGTERKIEDEIEEIENEIKRLSSRLEELRLEKAAAAANAKMIVEKKGRIVAAKFMEPKQVAGEESAAKNKIEETPKARDKVNNNNNNNTMMMRRRGLSLGPAEIARSRKADVAVTPVPATQSRRKSCFWKLPEVDERRESLSVSVGVGAGRMKKIQGQRQAATTNFGGSGKFVKKEDGVLELVQPRKLFKEGEKSVPNKKLLKPGRVVASRYNQIGNQSSGNSVAIKRSGQPSASKFPLCVGTKEKSDSLCGSTAGKRLLPENDKDDNCGRCDKRRASSVRMKKRWEIPAEVVVYESEEEEEKKKPLLLSSSSSSVPDMSDVLLPKIRTLRYATESPRDSGAAKRVAELTGKRSYFCPDKDPEESVCQVLSFADEGANDEE